MNINKKNMGKTRRKPKKTIKSIPNIKFISRTIIILIIIFITIIIISFYMDIFALRRVEVNGINRSTGVDVISIAAIPKNKNIFFISKESVKNNIEKNPLFIVKDILLKPPDMLSITIEEREAIALLEYQGGLVEITADKYILKESSIYNYNLPYLTGFNIDLKIDTVEDHHTKYIAQILGDLYKNNINVFNIISEIDGSGIDLIIYTRGYNIKVITEKYVAKNKFIKLASILTLLKNSDGDVMEIDMRFDEAIIKYK